MCFEVLGPICIVESWVGEGVGGGCLVYGLNRSVIRGIFTLFRMSLALSLGIWSSCFGSSGFWKKKRGALLTRKHHACHNECLQIFRCGCSKTWIGLRFFRIHLPHGRVVKGSLDGQNRLSRESVNTSYRTKMMLIDCESFSPSLQDGVPSWFSTASSRISADDYKPLR